MDSNILLKYLDKIQFFDFYGSIRRKIKKSQVIIMMYHRIGPITKDYWLLNPLSEKMFEYQIKYLSENFEIVSLNNLSEMIINNSIPKKAIAITFDDGYKDNYDFAFPILKKYNAPATIFVVTDPIEKNSLFWWDLVNYVLFHTEVEEMYIKGLGTYTLISDKDKNKASLNIVEKLKLYRNKESVIENIIESAEINIPDKLGKQYLLSWNEIKKMNKEGIDFGAHTVTHPILTNIPINEAKQEIVNSKNCIEDFLDTEIKSFAYPNGAFNEEILSLVRNSGFNSSVSVMPGLVKNSVDELYQLKRIYGETTNQYTLKSHLSGLLGDLRIS